MTKSLLVILSGVILSFSAHAAPELSGEQFLTRMRDEGKLRVVSRALMDRLDEVVENAALRERIASELAEILERQDFSRANRFPVIRLKDVKKLRVALRPFFRVETTRIEPVRGTLESLLGSCDVPRPFPQPMIDELQSIKSGHFPNLDLSDCESAHSDSLARVLTALGADNGSWVAYAGRRLRTPQGLIEALMQSGHRIEQRSERTLANFLSFTIDDQYDLRWPLWLDTGLRMSDGSNLVVPMQHSQFAWRISGPEVNARFVFFLGVSGVGFFGQNDVRPEWTGLKLAHRRMSDTDPALVLGTIRAASAYMSRIRQEHETVARNMPADGYGYLGICNDSSALLEAVSEGQVTSFPLVRAASLARTSPVEDELGDILASMPHDADGALNRQDVFGRILASFPHELNSPLILDEDLRAQLLEIEAELAHP